MLTASHHRYLAAGLILLFAACTTTVTKTKNPVFSVPMASLARQLDSLVPGGHKNLIGRSITTNGKDSSILEVDIINGRNLPTADAQKKELGRSIAIGIRNELKDKNEYKAFSVVFVKVDSGTIVTKKTWNGFTYHAADL